jgi:hypothetical protein
MTWCAVGPLYAGAGLASYAGEEGRRCPVASFASLADFERRSVAKKSQRAQILQILWSKPGIVGSTTKSDYSGGFNDKARLM